MMTSRRRSRSQTERRLRANLGKIFPDGTEHRLLRVSTSLRFSVPLLERIDAIAEAKAITRTETIERVLAWALDCLEPDRESLARIIQDRRRRPEKQGDSLESSKAASQTPEKD
jgi:hypothetical protein